MAYLKCVAAGLAAAVATVIVFKSSLVVVSLVDLPGSIWYDGRAIVQTWWFISLPIVTLAFAGGFRWEHHRAARSIAAR